MTTTADTGLTARLRANPFAVDALIAFGLTGISIVTIAGGAQDFGSYDPLSLVLLFTQTLPLLIYQDFELDFDVSLAVSALLVVVSAAVLITVKLMVHVSARARGGETPVSIALFRPGR